MATTALNRWQFAEIALGFGYDVILQDCDVLWTKNPLEDFRRDPAVGIVGGALHWYISPLFSST